MYECCKLVGGTPCGLEVEGSISVHVLSLWITVPVGWG